MRKPSSSPSPDAAAAGGGGGGSNKSTTTTPCCSKVGLKRGPWTPEEDQILSNFITKEGEGKWRSLPKRAGLLRCGKSCRLRWMNYLRPCVKRGHIAPDEEDLILRLHRLLGNRWSLIAGRIPGRTDNEIKNYWNTHLSKKLVSQGIDPRTHKPLQDMNHDFNSQKGVSNSTSPNPNPNHTHMMIPSDHSTQTAPLFHIKVNHSSSIDPTKTHRILSPDNDDDHHLDFGASFPMNDNNIGFGESSPVSLEEQEVDPNCCTDEVFSSFLNSLINEDMFTACQSQEQHELPNYDGGCSAPPQLNSFTAAALAGWGAPPLMFTSSLPSSSDAIQQSSPSDR